MYPGIIFSDTMYVIEEDLLEVVLSCSRLKLFPTKQELWMQDRDIIVGTNDWDKMFENRYKGISWRGYGTR